MNLRETPKTIGPVRWTLIEFSGRRSGPEPDDRVAAAARVRRSIAGFSDRSSYTALSGGANLLYGSAHRPLGPCPPRRRRLPYHVHKVRLFLDHAKLSESAMLSESCSLRVHFNNHLAIEAKLFAKRLIYSILTLPR
jgi:hypothetical protein